MKPKLSQLPLAGDPHRVFAKGDIRMNGDVDKGNPATSDFTTSHVNSVGDAGKVVLRALARHPRGVEQTRKRNYFELHGVDNDLATIVLLGGPYRGKRIREDMDARGLYLVNGVHGEFVYKLLQRTEQGAIAVPFDASEVEIRRCLFSVDGPTVSDAQLVADDSRLSSRTPKRAAETREWAYAQHA